MFFYFAVTMTEAYETLQGKSEESEVYFEEKLLQNALGDRERMAATKYVAGFITYKVYKLKTSQHSVLCYLKMFQLNLPRGVLDDQEFISLRSHGGLSAPTEDTLKMVINCDHAFNLMHGEGATVKDCKNVLDQTSGFISKLYPDIPDKIAKLFVKVKYHARVKALNEKDILVRGEELKRRAQERKEAPKKVKTVRDFSKDRVIKMVIFLQYLFHFKTFLTLCQFPTFK